MGYRYAVIGSGRQGTAAAYDLARFGEAEYLLLADQSLAQAERAAARVNSLIGREMARAAQVQVQDEDAVVEMLKCAGIEVFISGVPYFFNLKLTNAAIRAGASMCDFGGNTEQVWQQLAFDRQAKAAGITLIPDCGQVPGLGTSLCAYAVTGLIGLESVMVDGVPVVPRHLLHAVIEPQLRPIPNERDMVVIRIIARGLKDRQEKEAVIDLFDYHDEETGFIAMERTTGWHAAIMAGLIARGKTPRGGVPVELAVSGQVFVEEFRKRGFDLRVYSVSQDSLSE